jgi:hypothetical protein
MVATPKILSITILNSLRPFQLCYNVRTMAPIPISQPYSQEACEIACNSWQAEVIARSTSYQTP